MKTTTRIHGTECHTTDPGADRIEAFRRIVETRSLSKIDGVTVDLWTASTVLAVYEALNDANRAKFAAMNAHRMAHVALKLASGRAAA